MATDPHVQNETPGAAGRPDEAFGRAGERVGAFAALAGARVQSLFAQAAQTMQDAANRAGQGLGDAASRNSTAPDSTASDQSAAAPNAAPTDESAGPPPVERAEELVDIAGKRLGEFGQNTGQRLQAWWARLKEEGEDIVAEAQSIRRPDTPVH